MQVGANIAQHATRIMNFKLIEICREKQKRTKKIYKFQKWYSSLNSNVKDQISDPKLLVLSITTQVITKLGTRLNSKVAH